MRRDPLDLRLACLAGAALLVAGCGTPPRTAERDGPEANPPPDLHRVPDPIPRIEPIRPSGPNKPYEVFGVPYVPITADRPFTERGLASWYDRKFHGRQTASGETYNMYAMTAAHPTLPIPSYVRVRNPANGREVIVRVNDRGPFHRGRIIDLSYTAALRLDLLRGVAPVELERLTHDEIQSGAWRRDAVPDAPSAAANAPEPVAAPPTVDAARTPSLAATSSARGFWVQLGAFRERDGAVGFQQRVAAELDWLAPLLAIFEEQPGHRLQAGPYATREAAREAAQRVREALQLVPMIVERR
jgi:rare lipoprotein A